LCLCQIYDAIAVRRLGARWLGLIGRLDAGVDVIGNGVGDAAAGDGDLGRDRGGAAIAARSAVELSDERRGGTRWRGSRAGRCGTRSGYGNLKTGSGDRLRDPVHTGDGDTLTIGEDDFELAPGSQVEQYHAAADPDRRRRRLHRHRVVLLAELAADKAEDAAGQVGRELAGPGGRVEDELVDHHVGVRADGHRRLVDKQDLGLTFRPRGDAFLEDDVLPEDQLSRRGSRPDPGGVGVDRAVDADALLRSDGARHSEAEQQRSQRSSAQRIPDDRHGRSLMKSRPPDRSAPAPEYMQWVIG